MANCRKTLPKVSACIRSDVVSVSILPMTGSDCDDLCWVWEYRLNNGWRHTTCMCLCHLQYAGDLQRQVLWCYKWWLKPKQVECVQLQLDFKLSLLCFEAKFRSTTSSGEVFFSILHDMPFSPSATDFHLTMWAKPGAEATFTLSEPMVLTQRFSEVNE
jgi:hypothetical protein